MPSKYTVTLTSVGASSVITIPKPVVDGFSLHKGQKLQMIVNDMGIFVPLSVVQDGSAVEQNSKPLPQQKQSQGTPVQTKENVKAKPTIAPFKASPEPVYEEMEDKKRSKTKKPGKH
jgi:hypothetical protein